MSRGSPVVGGTADTEWVTSGQLAADLGRAGLAPGSLVMVHARMSAFPWMVGGAEGFMRGLLAAVGPAGTIAAYVGWEDHTYHLASWPPARQAAYRAGMPPFDPATSEARRRYGRLPERIRTWPGARRSAHPEMNMVAVGPLAGWLTAGTLDDDPWAPGSPLARVVEADGVVLMLGAPVGSTTIIHHAEYLAAVEPKRWVDYEMPVLIDGRTEWRRFRAIDTSRGAFDYPIDGDYVEAVVRSALEAGVGRRIAVLGTGCHMLPARALVAYAVSWIEDRVRAGSPR
jgi:aminoglycoside 3-N-acetyltransferase